jgi:hypothetical protein
MIDDAKMKPRIYHKFLFVLEVHDTLLSTLEYPRQERLTLAIVEGRDGARQSQTS